MAIGMRQGLSRDPVLRRSYSKSFRLRRLDIYPSAVKGKLFMQPNLNIQHFVQWLCNCATGIEAASPVKVGERACAGLIA